MGNDVSGSLRLGVPRNRTKHLHVVDVSKHGGFPPAARSYYFGSFPDSCTLLYQITRYEGRTLALSLCFEREIERGSWMRDEGWRMMSCLDSGSVGSLDELPLSPL